MLGYHKKWLLPHAFLQKVNLSFSMGNTGYGNQNSGGGYSTPPAQSYGGGGYGAAPTSGGYGATSGGYSSGGYGSAPVTYGGSQQVKTFENKQKTVLFILKNGVNLTVNFKNPFHPI